jgi:fluoroacetyl-CoA thioesterase
VKAGLQIGQTAEMEFTVTPEMRAQFGGEIVHDLLSTSTLVHYTEWVARLIILPYIEEHEEGMGSHVDISHLMMTPVGMKIQLKATVTAIRDNKVECEVEACNFRGKVAKATITQAIVQKQWLENKIREMALINGIVREQEQRSFR